MDRLKDNTGLIVLGAAALATAGFLLFKGGNKGGQEDTDASMREETEEILENSFFLDAAKTYAENEAIITKWTKEQCLALKS